MLLVRRSFPRLLRPHRTFATSLTRRQNTEEHVRTIRAQYGNYLPENLLSETELEVYERYYGAPLRFLKPQEWEDMQRQEADADEIVLDEGKVEIQTQAGEVFEVTKEEEAVYAPLVEQLEEEELGIVDDDADFEDAEDEGPVVRVHPLTKLGQFRTQPSTIMASPSVRGPTEAVLGDVNNKHLDEAAYRVLGGQAMVHSPLSTRRSERNYNGFPLDTSKFMGDMEANVYLATVLPGYYAQALSALTELRRRMGGDWVLGRHGQEQGVKQVLDVGGGGAGVLAWRDIVTAEQSVRNETSDPEAPGPKSESTLEELLEPGGLKATVVTGAESLRFRMKGFLENTTFIPHLPDTKEKASEEQPRKLYDLVISTNTLLPLFRDHQRRSHMQNLWSLVNPHGGVLLLIEKGTPAGFEAIAEARSLLLSTAPDLRLVAPCTTHEACPMYIHGASKGSRKDWCRFTQRYERPGYMQRILKATVRNHEDIEYSYVAMRRAPNDPDQDPLPEINPDLFDTTQHPVKSPYSMPQLRRHALTLPRLVFPPMKRHGHVILDLCTPAGKIERWTVPRSYGRAAYRDARKSKWGDLWALGAKTKISRNLKLGDKRGGPKMKVLRLIDGDKGEVKEVVMEKDKKGGRKNNPGKRERDRRKIKEEIRLVKEQMGVKKEAVEEDSDDED